MHLTPAEIDVLEGVMSGEPLAVIAARRGTSRATVKTQMEAIRLKLGAATQAHAVAIYLRREGTP